jgi:hypothetical protein
MRGIFMSVQKIIVKVAVTAVMYGLMSTLAISAQDRNMTAVMKPDWSRPAVETDSTAILENLIKKVNIRHFSSQTKSRKQTGKAMTAPALPTR